MFAIGRKYSPARQASQADVLGQDIPWHKPRNIKTRPRLRDAAYLALLRLRSLAPARAAIEKPRLVRALMAVTTAQSQ